MSVIGDFEAQIAAQWAAIDWDSLDVDASKQVFRYGDLVPYLEANNKVTNVEWFRISVEPTAMAATTLGMRQRFDYNIDVVIEAFTPAKGSNNTREWELLDTLTSMITDVPNGANLSAINLDHAPDGVIEIEGKYRLNG